MFKDRLETLVFVSLPVGSNGGQRRVLCMVDGSDQLHSRLVLSDAFGRVTSNILFSNECGQLPQYLDPKPGGTLSDFLKGRSKSHAQLMQFGLTSHGLLTAARAILYSRQMPGRDAVVRSLEISRRASDFADRLPGILEMSEAANMPSVETNFAVLAA